MQLTVLANPFALLLLTNHKIPEGVKCNGSTYCHEFPISTALEAIACYINSTWTAKSSATMSLSPASQATASMPTVDSVHGFRTLL